MAKALAFPFIDPALRNQLHPLLRSSLLTGESSASFLCLQEQSLFSGSLTLEAPDWCGL